jgi:proton-dependent oligopeptide transporter, POT family
MSDSSDALIDRPVAARSRDFLGHPRGLSFLFATEMWERFSYYGMRALLVLYMVKYLFQPNHMETVFGLAALRHGLEAVSGPLDAQPLASQIYGLYTGLVYLTPLFGGMLADRVLGQRRTVIIGAVLMAIGHFMMAFEQLLLFALLALILGSGAFKPNISTQVGGLYQSGDHRRDRAYSIFYVGINVGAFLAPLICGSLGEEVGWHYGFGAAGVGMLIGLAIYLYAWPLLPQDELSKRVNASPPALSPSAKRRIVALLILFLPATLFWATYEQQGNTVALWADAYTDRTIDLVFWATEIPTTWFQSLNPIMIVAFTPLVVALWSHQAKTGSEPSTVNKMALGCLGVALANLIMMIAALGARPTNSVSLAWLLAYFIVMTIGELYLSPTSLSLVSKVAPAPFLSMLMGLWLATSFVGNLLSGWLGSFWSSMDKAHFFLMIAAIAVTASAAIFAVNRPLSAALNDD